MQTSILNIFTIDQLEKNGHASDSDLKSFSHPHSPIWQTYWWTKFLRESGYIDQGFCIHSDDFETVCFVQKRSLGMGQYGLFCLGGPLGDESMSENLSHTLTQLCQDEKCLFVQIEPLDENNDLHLFTSRPIYKRFIEPVTALIDLSASEEDILAQMKPKGRYNIKLGAKHDIQISRDSSVAAVESFYELLTQTTQRNHFSGNDLGYYLALCKTLEEKNLGGLYVAKKNGEIIAGSIFIYYGNVATYYYGASTSDNTKRKYMPSYALQWQAMQDAKQKGCQWFDFLGIARPGDTKSHLAGVTDFKMKFGPQTHTWPDAQIYIAHPLKYRLFLMIRKIKSLIR